MKSRTLSRTSDTTETRNPCVIKVILLACFTYIDIIKFIKYGKNCRIWLAAIGSMVHPFNRAVVPYEISKVNFRVETKIIVSMSEEMYTESYRTMKLRIIPSSE
jgi:hypothetical protein